MSTWGALGFSGSPYNTQPLKVDAAHVPFLVGRSEEGVRFCTYIDSANEGVFVISGSPGVGKTSFFNIFQHLLETGQAACGPRLLAARVLCALRPDDDPRSIALRVVHTLIKNVKEYCSSNSIALPAQVAKLDEWANCHPTTSWDFSLSILGNGGGIGRSVNVPPLSEASFENFCDAIVVVIAEVRASLGVDGAFIALDNVENLADDRLADVLMAFRDTLFSVEKVWWVIIGQSGLYSLIQALDPRVTDRITGSGLELSPITLDELHTAVEHRVEKFHVSQSGKAPLSSGLHKMLYDASFGEIRFVFKYSNTLCLEIVGDLRKRLLERKAPLTDAIVNDAIGAMMVEDHIPDQIALGVLRRILKQEIDGLGLRARDRTLLASIGEKGSARSKDYEEFGFKSGQDFSSNYLTRLQVMGLLVRVQEGRAAIYRLRGLAVLGRDLGLLAS